MEDEEFIGFYSVTNTTEGNFTKEHPFNRRRRPNQENSHTTSARDTCVNQLTIYSKLL